MGQLGGKCWKGGTHREQESQTLIPHLRPRLTIEPHTHRKHHPKVSSKNFSWKLSLALCRLLPSV